MVRNEASVAQIQKLTCNLLPKLVRHDSMEGREFIVVPMVILTEGVHNGSDGPLYYPPDELSKTPAIWNHKPVVVYHPEMNGAGVSACSPDIITSHKVGVMMNTKFEKGRLRSEAWIERDRANSVDDRIMVAVEAGEMMELSTGVFVDCEDKTGDWNGENYVGVARNFRPDHLALLPDKIGACSIKDGAGFLRNQEGKKDLAAIVIQRALERAGLVDNEMSHSNIHSSLSSALRKKFNADIENGPFLFVEDVYSNFVIYNFDGKNYRLGYSASDAGVSLSEDQPVEVVRVTEYRTVEGAFVGNQDKERPGTMKKKQKIVDAIIANSEVWSEEDRTSLMALNELQLEGIQKALIPPTENEEDEEGKEKGKESKSTSNKTKSKKDDKSAPTQLTENEQEKEKPIENKEETVDDFIKKAPAQIQEVLRNGISVYDEEKQKLIKSLTDNEDCPFSEEELNNRPLGELRKLSTLAGRKKEEEQVVDYSGQGHVRTNTKETEEPLEVPVMNFDRN